MANKLVALGVAAMSLLTLSAVDPAEAPRGYDAHSFRGRVDRSGPGAFAGSHHDRHYHRHLLFIGPPFAYGYYNYGYGHWLWLWLLLTEEQGAPPR